TVTITAIQPRLRLSGTNRLGFQPSMAISDGIREQRTGDSGDISRLAVVQATSGASQPRRQRPWSGSQDPPER
ncbi:MAG: hypothetical protein KZQ65_12750, partial [Candidatus Thiodiazotropha sp. (ex Gloverina cf. vestifex)]|nr:hypothetical protein [Candidatus Thiodiazotropha sp. (ex Gloverina cf. vestifex)]